MAYRRKPVLVRSSQGSSNNGADVGLTLAGVRSHIHFMTVRVESIICDSPNDQLQQLIDRGQLFGFKLDYKVPNGTRGNLVLNREVVANSAAFNSSEIVFKHKKVYSIELDPELVNKFDSSSIQFALHMISARNARQADPRNTVLRPIARTAVALSDLLIPPFHLSRDFHIVGSELEFDGVLSVSIELGTRNVRLAERLQDMRKSDLDNTFNVQERVPMRTRARSRSQSRCRSCSSADENRSPSPVEVAAPQPQPRRRSQSVSKPRQPLPQERFILPRPPSPPPARNNTHLREQQQQQWELIPPPFPPPRPFSCSTTSEDSDSVFLPQEQQHHDVGRSSQASQRSRGAVELELTLHEATNLPYVKDQRGHMVPPRAFIQMLGREEQVQSTVAAPNRNPKWNWTGTFVFSQERGNLLIKVLHRTEDDRIESLGMVTLNSPLRSFEFTEFELTPLVSSASGLSTITLSLVVSRRAPSRVEIGHPDRDRFLSATRSSRASGSTRSDEGSVIRWVGSARHPQLRLMSDSLSVSRSPPLPTRRNWHEDTSHKLHENLNDLQNAIRQLR